MMAKFVIFLDDAGYYRWRLVAGNGEKVATSGEGFYSRQSAVRAAKRVKELASQASIEV